MSALGFCPFSCHSTKLRYWINGALPLKSVSSRRISKFNTTSRITMEERFDILHEDGSSAGFSKARSFVHRDGDWHRSTHIWVLSTDGKVLVQKRSSTKDTFPGRWDVSAAGHLTAGDESGETARRELEEELGISLPKGEQLEYVMTVKSTNTGETQKHGKFNDNEIQDIYLYRPKNNIDIDGMVLQTEEVEKVEYQDWNEYCKLVIDSDPSVVPRSKEYCERFFPWLKNVVAKY